MDHLYTSYVSTQLTQICSVSWTKKNNDLQEIKGLLILGGFFKISICVQVYMHRNLFIWNALKTMHMRLSLTHIDFSIYEENLYTDLILIPVNRYGIS